jgi:hypothetical protein
MTLYISKSLWIMTAAVTGTALLAGILWRQRESSASADVPLLKTSAWQGGMPEYGEQIMLRREIKDRGALLLKHSKRDMVYRYDPTTTSLTAVSEQTWNAASSPIAECGKQFSPPANVLNIDKASNSLMAGTRRISTAGRTVLKITESPSKRWVAVLSASGPLKPSLVPFSGGSAASGEHYHQVISLPDAVPVGTAVQLPVEQDSDLLVPCWSADEREVIYHEILFTYLSVVETQVTQPPMP